ncbi:MAG: twin-arginine translocase TatA/TatE family subunit [Flavobacteriaceae bacterium]
MALSEIALIIVIGLMLFGSKNIPEIARTLGKGMAQIKNATNDIKSEISKSADFKEITDIKGSIEKEITGLNASPTDEIVKEIDKVKENIDDMTGPIKRQR